MTEALPRSSPDARPARPRGGGTSTPGRLDNPGLAARERLDLEDLRPKRVCLARDARRASRAAATASSYGTGTPPEAAQRRHWWRAGRRRRGRPRRHAASLDPAGRSACRPRRRRRQARPRASWRPGKKRAPDTVLAERDREPAALRPVDADAITRRPARAEAACGAQAPRSRDQPRAASTRCGSSVQRPDSRRERAPCRHRGGRRGRGPPLPRSLRGPRVEARAAPRGVLATRGSPTRLERPRAAGRRSSVPARSARARSSCSSLRATASGCRGRARSTLTNLRRPQLAHASRRSSSRSPSQPIPCRSRMSIGSYSPTSLRSAKSMASRFVLRRRRMAFSISSSSTTTFVLPMSSSYTLVHTDVYPARPPYPRQRRSAFGSRNRARRR